MLQLSGEKMSKSIGNLVTIEEFLSKHTADTLRFMVINSGYRGPLTFNDEVIGQAERALERLASGLKPAQADAPGLSVEQLAALNAQTEKTRSGFTECMNDDFNSSGAMGNLFDLTRVINQARADGANNEQLNIAQKTIKEYISVLGLSLLKKEAFIPAEPYKETLEVILSEVKKVDAYNDSDEFRIIVGNFEDQVENIGSSDISTFGDSLVDLRDVSRNLKFFEDADYLRRRLNDLGFSVEDSKGGTIIYRK
jgi:cysteinyl-tRNA synthetase